MDEDDTLYEVDLGAGHIVLDGFPLLRERGTAPPPLLGPCLLWPRSPISATAELLLSYASGQTRRQTDMKIAIHRRRSNQEYGAVPAVRV